MSRGRVGRERPGSCDVSAEDREGDRGDGNLTGASLR